MEVVGGDGPLLPPARHRCGKAALSASLLGASITSLFPARREDSAAGLAAGSCPLGFVGAKMGMMGSGPMYGWSRCGVPSPASSFAWLLWLAAAGKQRSLSRC